MNKIQYLFIVSLLCLFLIDHTQAQNAKVGTLAPDFSTQTLTGQRFSLYKQRGKVVVINFFTTACPWCLKELPHLEKEVFLKYKDRTDFQMIAIARGQNKAVVKQFVAQKKFRLPFASDPHQAIFKKYAKKMIPRTYVIGKDGKIKKILVGYTKPAFQELLKVISQELKKP